MIRRRWKETVYIVYNNLVELVNTKGTRQIRLAELAVKTGYSPVYLRVHILPILINIVPCVKYKNGIISYECEGGGSK